MRRFGKTHIGTVACALFVATLTLFIACLCACTGQSGTDASSSEGKTAPSASALRFFTAGEAGTYYAFGSVIAQHATNNAGVAITALASGGSQANVEALQDGDAELAFCQSDVMTYAYTGTKLFDEAVSDSFSVVGVTFQECVQIVTLDPSIQSVSDLKGKTVSLGAAGSGMYFGALDVLSAYGLDESDINVTRQGNADAMNSLKNNQIDAAFLVAPAPNTAVVDLSNGKQVHLISLDDEHVAQIIARSPFYVQDTIPAGTYAGIDTDVSTVSVSAVILARNDVDEDAIYRLCKDIYDDPASLVDLHAKYAEIDAETGASATTVPYHPGAARYFTERGYSVLAP